MPFELEALVGHLYIAGGRTIKTTPPGALCEVAPRRAARGREVDTFFTLVLPSGTIAPNTFYQQMALMAAERYFSNTGSVTSALREVYNSLNNNLFEHNQGNRTHYEAAMLSVVLRSEELFVARVGAAALALYSNAETVTFPADLNNDEALFKPPLGVQPIPEVEMSRYKLHSGSRVLLADANIAEIQPDKLRDALQAATLEEVLEQFKLLVTLQTQLLVAEFVPPEEPVPVPTVTGQSSAVLAAEIASRRNRPRSPEPAAAPETRDELPMERPARRPRQPAKRILASLARQGGHGLRAIGDLLDRVFVGKSENRRISPTFLMGTVIGVPVLVIATVLLSWVLNVGQTAFEECVTRAQNAANFARSVESNDPSSVIASWQTTLTIVGECNDLRPDNTDASLTEIQREGQAVIDRLNGISRRSAIPVWTSPDEGANIGTLVLQGLDLYALDTTTELVYRVQLSGDGLSASGNPQPIANMRAGARVESLGLNLAGLIDIAFDPDNNLIAAVDDNGVLVRCRPLFINQCDHQRLLGTENWGTPIAIHFYLGNLYVLDIASGGSGQIWRYEPIGGDNYSSPPIEYFRASVRPDLSAAVDFTISAAANTLTRGQIYVLRDDGVLSAFFRGEAVPFLFSGFREGQELTSVSTQAMYLNDSPIDTGFFITSRPTRTIYETTAAGTFVAAYRVTDESLLERMNDIVVDAEQGIIYVASGNSIFALRKDG